MNELEKQAYELCLAIEQLPASEYQTKLSVMASDLFTKIKQSKPSQYCTCEKYCSGTYEDLCGVCDKPPHLKAIAKYAQIENLINGEIFRVVEETAGEVYFYDESHRWCYFSKSEEGISYRYIPAGIRLTNNNQ